MERTTQQVPISRLMRERAVKGSHISRVPLGYERIPGPSGALLRPEKKTAKLLQDALVAISCGSSLRTALAKATSAALLNRNGQPLSLSSFHRIVTNPFYAGRVRFNGKEYQGTHEPLIDQTTFKRVLKVLGKHRC